MSYAQNTIDALDEAGRLLAPILQAETVNGNVPDVSIRRGNFTVYAHVDRRLLHFISGDGPTLSAAFMDFLAKRSVTLAELEQEERQRADFEAWKAQRVSA